MDKKLINIKKKRLNNKNKLEQLSNKISYLRLLIFLLCFIICIYNIKYNLFILTIINILLFICFILIIIKHNKVIKEIKKTDLYLSIISRYENRTNNLWKKESLNQLGTYDYPIEDLDIIGDNSLLKYLDFTCSKGGFNNLVNSLSLNNYNKKSILNNQSSITELKNKQEFILDFIYELSSVENIKETSYQDFFSYFVKPSKENKVILYLSSIISFICITLAILSIFNIIKYYYLVPFILLGLTISYLFTLKHQEEFEAINKTARSFSNLNNIYKFIIKEKFTSSYNKKLQSIIINGQSSLKELTDIANLNSYRLNFITYLLGNIFFSLNFIIIHKYNVLINHRLDSLKESIKALEEYEKLISLTTICFVKENLVLPIINNDLLIDTKEIRHPLIEENKCVSNTFITNKDINIITGSNMSGKTSFMKTIGTNLVLAYNGTYVNANYFSFPLAKLFTSINVKDDISRGISTFYGELKRIKDILDYSENNKNPMIIFIDEIFKGTNYNDRILGAKETLKELATLNCIVFLTTHDFELCSIKNKIIKNYHFSESYDNNRILFDYKIKEGQCKTTNAKYLMKQMKIIK